MQKPVRYTKSCKQRKIFKEFSYKFKCEKYALEHFKEI